MKSNKIDFLLITPKTTLSYVCTNRKLICCFECVSY